MKPAGKESITQAIIYCRVSSAKQKINGAGLESQEHLCRKYAERNGYTVVAVFPDDITGGGDFMQRPGMRALLSFLDAQPGKRFAVIFDDLKRFARDTQFHLKLRQEFNARLARVECLNFQFDDTPEGRFAETIFAAQGELEREQNRRQTIQKMMARLEKGFWVFHAPIGYEYKRTSAGGKAIVPKEPYASILREALEGYACGRLETPFEVKRYLEGFPDWPKDLPNGEVRHQRIHDYLTRPVYAGYVENPKWNVSLRKGQHEGLIDWQTYERIQERLTGGRKAPARKDINADFPLRQFVLCADCQKPMTACWSKSSTGVKHPYYLCATKGCASYRKSVRRSDLEGEFAALLRTLQPTDSLVKIAGLMFKDAWGQRAAQAEAMLDGMKRQIVRIEKDVEQLVDRIIESSNATVVAAIEAKIDRLEREKLILREKLSAGRPDNNTYEELFELALAFLSSPWKLWESGQLNLRRTVLRLAFSERIAYDRKTGFRTPKTTLPFKVLEAFSTGKSGMAHH